MEEIAQGERVRAYEVEGEQDGEWVSLCKGISVGHKRIQQFPAVAVRKVRLRVTEAVAEPHIRELAVYDAKS